MVAYENTYRVPPVWPSEAQPVLNVAVATPADRSTDMPVAPQTGFKSSINSETAH